LQHNVTTLSILHPRSPSDACLPPRQYIFWCLRQHLSGLRGLFKGRNYFD
jgi:hypothetical protein